MCGISRWLALGEERKRGLVGYFGPDQKAVAFARNGLDVERPTGGIAERLAELVDGGIYVGVVVYVRVGGPEAYAQLFAGNDFARFFEECQKNLINLPLELEPGPVPRHFLPLLVNPEWPKIDVAARGEECPL